MFKIKMTMSDSESNHRLSMEEHGELYPDLGDGELERLSTFLDSFLKAYGYPRFGKGYVFLESVTEEEYIYLYDCLCGRRAVEGHQ